MATKPKVNLGLVEEDDELEEFPVEAWTAKDKDDVGDSNWDEKWEQDNVDDDFKKLLLAEMEAMKAKKQGENKQNK